MSLIKWTLLVTLVSLNAVHVAGKCSITADWLDLTMEERLSLSDIVVYGRTKEHRSNPRIINGKSSHYIDAVFEVYCVLKKQEDAVNEVITIESVFPRNGCSGTKEHMRIDSEAVVALTPTYGGKYEFHEVMPLLSATFAGVKSNLVSISAICGLQAWQPAQGATVNRCPICGTNNFTDDSITRDTEQDINKLPCFVNGVFNGNLSDCRLNEVATSSTDKCLSKKFSRTCARLSLTTPNVGCECTAAQNSPSNFGPIGEIDTATTCSPSGLMLVLITMGVCLVFGRVAY